MSTSYGIRYIILLKTPSHNWVLKLWVTKLYSLREVLTPFSYGQMENFSPCLSHYMLSLCLDLSSCSLLGCMSNIPEGCQAEGDELHRARLTLVSGNMQCCRHGARSHACADRSGITYSISYYHSGVGRSCNISAPMKVFIR